MKSDCVDVFAILGGAAVAAMVVTGCGDNLQTSRYKQQIIEAAEQEAQKYNINDPQCGDRWEMVAGLRDMLDTPSVREAILQKLGISSTELYRLANTIRQSYSASACFVNTIVADGQRVITNWEVGQPTIGPWGCNEKEHPERCNPFQPMYDDKAIISLSK